MCKVGGVSRLPNADYCVALNNSFKVYPVSQFALDANPQYYRKPCSQVSHVFTAFVGSVLAPAHNKSNKTETGPI